MIEPATDEQVAQWLKMYAYVPPGHGGFEGRRIQILLARIEADGQRIAGLTVSAERAEAALRELVKTGSPFGWACKSCGHVMQYGQLHDIPGSRPPATCVGNSELVRSFLVDPAAWAEACAIVDEQSK